MVVAWPLFLLCMLLSRMIQHTLGHCSYLWSSVVILGLYSRILNCVLSTWQNSEIVGIIGGSEKNTQTFVPFSVFELATATFVRSKTVCSLNYVAAGISVERK